MKKYIFATIFIFIFSQSSNAQLYDTSFFQWTIYELKSSALDEKKCYMVAKAVKSESNHTSRQEPYIMITRYQDRRIEEISIYSGFDYKGSSKVLVMIDEEKFEMPTNKDMAWARSKEDDVRMIQKMLTSAKLQVRADSAVGTFAIDEYSLEGVAKSYNRLKRICN